jgi:hypothetical protein
LFLSRSSLSAAVVLAAAVSARAQPAMFEVGGTLEPSDRGLTVQLSLRNSGPVKADNVKVFGELLGTRASANLVVPLGPGAASEARLAFPEAVPAAGVHALVLRLEYESAAPGRPEAMNQYAYLLLGFGGASSPAVRLEVPRAQVRDSAEVPVILESVDGRPHRASLSIYLPRTLGAAPARQDVDVPPRGPVIARVRLFRSLATYDSTHGLLAVAVTQEDGVARTSAATSVVEIGADTAVLPRLRWLLLGTAVALLIAAALRERRTPATA